VLLLDEPTAHLDAATARAMMADIRRASGDRIVVLVSHRAEDRRAGDVVLTLGASAAAGTKVPASAGQPLVA
jgi:ATP-binding cassette subfamily C protein CydCD